jgi:hypothetical protein
LVLILIELTMMINSDSFRSDFNPNNWWRIFRWFLFVLCLKL